MKIRSLAVRVSLLIVALSLVCYLAQARYPQPKQEYQARREKLRTQLDGPLVLFGYTSRQEGGEVAVFFQDENFYYLSGYDEPDAALLELVADRAACAPEWHVAQRELQALMDHWLDDLPAKQRLVIERRYGLNGLDPATLDDLARELGLTRERVRQIQQEALVRLQQVLQSRGVRRDVLY